MYMQLVKKRKKEKPQQTDKHAYHNNRLIWRVQLVLSDKDRPFRRRNVQKGRKGNYNTESVSKYVTEVKSKWHNPHQGLFYLVI